MVAVGMESLPVQRWGQALERGTCVHVYPFMKIRNPETNVLSSPPVQVIENES